MFFAGGKAVSRGLLLAISALWLVSATASAQEEAASSIQSLMRELGDENAYVRRTAAEALGRAAPDGKEAIGLLIQALDDGDAGVRSNAAAALDRFGEAAASAAPALIKALEDESVATRRIAATALASVKPDDPGAAATALIKAARVEGAGIRPVVLQSLFKLGPDAVPAMAEALLDPTLTERVRVIIIFALKEMGRDSHAAAPALVKVLKLDSPFLRQQTLEALANYGDDTVGYLAEALTDDDMGFRGRRMVAAALTPVGRKIDVAVPALIEALQDSDSLVRQYAVAALGNANSQAAARAVIAVLRDEDVDVRRQAAESLSQMGASAVSELVVAAKDKDVEVRRLAGEILGQIGSNGEQAVPALLGALDDEDISVRWVAVKSLENFGTEAGPAVPRLIALLQRERARFIRRDTIVTLGAIGPEAAAALPALIQVLDQQDATLQEVALTALARLGPKAGAALPWIEKGLRSQELAVRKASLEAWAAIKKDKAVPELLVALRDPDAAVRRQALHALGGITPLPEPKATVPALIAALQDADAEVRESAANVFLRAGPSTTAALPDLIVVLEGQNSALHGPVVRSLRTMGPAAKAAVPAMTRLLNGADRQFRMDVLTTLAAVGPEAQSAVPDLLRLLQSDDASLRAQVPRVLASIGGPAGTVVPALTRQIVEAKDTTLRVAAAEAIGQLSEKLLDARDYDAVADLGAARQAIVGDEWLMQGDRAQRAVQNLDRAIYWLEESKWDELKEKALGWVQEHPILAVGIPLYLLWILAVLAILWLRPLALLRINTLLKHFDFVLPGWLGGLRLPLSSLLVAGLFSYHPRVLDAWVRAHVASVRERFAKRDTVKDRQTHIEMPVVIDGAATAQFGPVSLRPTFGQRLGCLLIWGEGGAGKTSLACQIANWAMAEEREKRLCRHLMVPVLIEHELSLDTPAGRAPLTEAIAKQLQDLTDQAEPLPAELLSALLTERRVLVIVDHLSEMSEATRAKINPQLSDFPANALIVTSRIEEPLGGVTKTEVRPMRVAGNRLSSFMEAYLLQQGVRDLFEDREFFQACSQLSAMVGDRDITVLLAKLYAEELISQKRRVTVGELPKSVPDLMLGYLNELNRAVKEDRFDDRMVHRDAKAIAWECMKATFRPGAARHDDALAALGEADGDDHLRYLEERLRLVQHVQPAQEYVRLVLDPLAEYLAGLHLIDHFGADERLWRDLIERARRIEGGPIVIRGFLLALRDCCIANGAAARTPPFVEPELRRLAG